MISDSISVYFLAIADVDEHGMLESEAHKQGTEHRDRFILKALAYCAQNRIGLQHPRRGPANNTSLLSVIRYLSARGAIIPG